MTDDPCDWNAVASAKLIRVLGPTEGPRTLAETLAELKLERIATRSQFMEVANSLSKREGFAAMVGSLLSVHAMIHRA